MARSSFAQNVVSIIREASLCVQAVKGHGDSVVYHSIACSTVYFVLFLFAYYAQNHMRPALPKGFPNAVYPA